MHAPSGDGTGEPLRAGVLVTRVLLSSSVLVCRAARTRTTRRVWRHRPLPMAVPSRALVEKASGPASCRRSATPCAHVRRRSAAEGGRRRVGGQGGEEAMVPAEVAGCDGLMWAVRTLWVKDG